MMMMIRQAFLLVAAALVATGGGRGASAFVLPTPRASMTTTSTPSTTQLSQQNTPVSTGFDSFKRIENAINVPSGEEQRKYRRTVYTHDDWKKHRNQNRFVVYLAAMFKSGVYKNLAGEVILTTAVAALVVYYNAIVGGYDGLAGATYPALITSDWLPKLSLPLAAFTLTSPSLGLLLVFRTNTSYQRWDEARKNWGMNINHTRDLVRMANAYYDASNVSKEQRQDDLNHVALCTWAFVRAMKRHLSPVEEDEADYAKELYEKLPEKQAEMTLAAAHRPNRALQDLSYAIDDLPMHFLRKNEIHRAVTIFEDNLGSSERILTSPVPLVYSRHLARFLAVWLILLPFGLYDSFANSWNHIAMVPATTVISVMLFGIEEIGTQLEEPFTVLPMQSFCDKIYNWCMEIAKWSPGDNGRPMKALKTEVSVQQVLNLVIVLLL
jgi:ion channel-forming bestrophin family protein